MQNDSMSVRGYSPDQHTGRMSTMSYQPQQVPRQCSLWQQLDPAAVALLAACVLGLAYALYVTISFWWLKPVLPHLIVTWVALLLNGIAMFSGRRQVMLLTCIGYVAGMLLFVNYMYLLIPQAILCLIAWWRAGK